MSPPYIRKRSKQRQEYGGREEVHGTNIAAKKPVELSILKGRETEAHLCKSSRLNMD